MPNSSIWLRSTLLTASTLTVMAGAIIAPALPEISIFFEGKAPEVYIKLLLTIPAVGIVMFSAIMGNMTDRIGRKPVLLFSLMLFGISGLSGIFIDNLLILLISRLFLGIAVAGIMNSTTAMAGDYFQGEERSQFLGLQASFMAIGGILFLNIGGLLAEWSWRGPFFVYGFALVILPFAFLKLPKIIISPRNKTAPVIKPEKNAITIMYFVFVMGFLGMSFFYLVPIQIPYLFKSNFDASNMLIGFSISLSTLTGAVASFNYKKVASIFPAINIYGLTFLFMGASYLIISFSNNLYLTMAGLAIGGLGTGLMMPNGNLIALRLVPEAVRGKWLGGLTTSIFLGQFLSPIMVAPIISVYDIKMAFLVIAIIALTIGITLYTRKIKI